MTAATRALPEGARVVHIGPHKTGTTAIQASLWAARPELLRQGVRHVGASRNPSAAARSVAESPSPYSRDKPPSIRNWQRLLGEFRRAVEARTVVSSEMFAWAKAPAIRRIVDDLDPGRLHVVITLRPLERVIPSTWQQNVQAGTVMDLDGWVRELLADGNRPFWHLQRHDELVGRWLDAVRPGHLSAIVVDDRDHGFLLRAFEALLGVREGTLGGVRDLMNRSMTMPEAEAVRAFNQAYAAEGLPRDLHARVMRFGAAQHMKRRPPAPEEPAVRLPEWARGEVANIQAEIVAGLRSSGVPILGDLDLLLAGEGSSVAAESPTELPAESPTELPAEPPTAASQARASSARPPAAGIPPEVVGSMGMALLESTGALRSASVSKGPFKFAEPAEVARVPTYQLAGTVAGRAWRATVGRLVGTLRQSDRSRQEIPDSTGD